MGDVSSPMQIPRNLSIEPTIEVQRIKVGKMKSVETLINEEALLFTKYIRNERQMWIPRLAVF